MDSSRDFVSCCPGLQQGENGRAWPFAFLQCEWTPPLPTLELLKMFRHFPKKRENSNNFRRP